MSKRFQQSIDEYFQNRQNLEYLDLASELNSRKESTEGVKFSCYGKGFRHIYHTENRQLNLLCDMQLNTLHNLHVVYDRVNLLSKVCLKHLYSLDEKVEKLEKQLEYLYLVNKRLKKFLQETRLRS